MRSRYSAYVLGREDYLLASWHASTRPPSMNLDAEAQTKWLGLDVKRHEPDATHPDKAIVEFVARFKLGGGRAERLHEVSRFIREEGRWFYLKPSPQIPPNLPLQREEPRSSLSDAKERARHEGLPTLQMAKPRSAVNNDKARIPHEVLSPSQSEEPHSSANDANAGLPRSTSPFAKGGLRGI